MKKEPFGSFSYYPIIISSFSIFLVLAFSSSSADIILQIVVIIFMEESKKYVVMGKAKYTIILKKVLLDATVFIHIKIKTSKKPIFIKFLNYLLNVFNILLFLSKFITWEFGFCCIIT